VERGSIDYRREATSLSFKVNFHAFSTWFDLVPTAVLQAVRDGLDATKKKNDWGLASWPRQTVTNLNPFQDRRNDFAVIFELVNDKNEVIGRQSLNLRGSWSFNFSANEVSVNYQENNFQTVTFSAVDANKITTTLTIRVASVNGADPQTVTRNGSLQITALSAFPPSGLEFSRGVITRYTGSGGNVVIPAAIWGEPVKTISARAFEKKNLTSVTIPDSVTTIEEGAFFGNRLNSVIISNSVTTIGKDVFRENQLTSVTIPDSVTTIEKGAFFGNVLTSVTIPNSIRTIGEGAFRKNMFTSIPDNVRTIGKDMFRENRFTAVTIPNSVTTIEEGAFHENQLTSITIGANVNMPSVSLIIAHQLSFEAGSKYLNEHIFDDFVQYYNNHGKKSGTYSRRSSFRTKGGSLYGIGDNFIIEGSWKFKRPGKKMRY
jgi:hypothetical protein